MKQRIGPTTASSLGSLLVLGLISACHVTFEKDDGTGGQSATSSGGAQGGSGALPDAGGSAPRGGSAAAGSNVGGQLGMPYVEECGTPEPFDNDDRDAALALGSGATLCLADADDDWFYVDTPADGKAHVLQLDFVQEPTAWTDLSIFSNTDGSKISAFHLDKGVKTSAFVTLGPGARTLIDFSPYISGDASVTVKASLTAENDSYEPNNARDTAAAIEPARELSGQMLVPYVAQEQAESADWFKLELTAGAHVFHLTRVPRETWLEVHISDSARVNLTAGHAPNEGATFDLSFTAPTAGTYFFAVESYLSVPPIVSVGSEPHFLIESYAFQID